MKINIDDMWSNHSAIFGNTGSGKSCSVARIVQNIFLNKQFLSYNANTLSLLLNKYLI